MNKILACILLIIPLFLTALEPEADPNAWIRKVAKRELKPYRKKGISRKQIERAWAKLKEKPEFKRYKIVRSEVYGPEGRMKNLLQMLVSKYPMPDVDFIHYQEDRIKKSIADRDPEKYDAPIFVSAKDTSLAQFILFADWLYDPTVEDQGWNHILNRVNQYQVDWSEKIEKLFWRGSAFDGQHFMMYDFKNWKTIPRGTLVHQSRKHPDLIDAAFSSYPDACVEKDPARCLAEMGPTSFVPVEDQLVYKYHLIIDGVTCTFPATQWKLLSGSVSFKQDSPNIQYFFHELEPWVHYIPVSNDLSDLLDRIRWAKEHDRAAQKIAENGRNFALTHLMPEHILAYCREVLVRYAALQKFQPTLDPSDIGF